LAGFDAATLKLGGYDYFTLKLAGFAAEELRDAGFVSEIELQAAAAKRIADRPNIFVAVESGDLELVQDHLIADASSVSGCNSRSSLARCVSPLHIAAWNNRVDVCRLLVKFNADIDATDMKNATPLHYAAATGRMDTLQFLVESKADVTIINSDGQTPLLSAIKHNKSTLVAYLRSIGAP